MEFMFKNTLPTIAGIVAFLLFSNTSFHAQEEWKVVSTFLPLKPPITSTVPPKPPTPFEGGQLPGEIKIYSLHESDGILFLTGTYEYPGTSRPKFIYTTSKDNGASWSPSAELPELAESVGDTSTFVSQGRWFTNNRQGVFVSEDNARTWKRIQNSPVPSFAPGSFAVGSGVVLFAGEFKDTAAKLFVSSDNASTWTPLASPSLIRSKIFYSAGSFVFIGPTDSTGAYAVYVSRDNGKSWTFASLPYPRNLGPVTVSGKNIYVGYGGMLQTPAVLSGGLLVSKDSGKSWSLQTNLGTVNPSPRASSGAFVFTRDSIQKTAPSRTVYVANTYASSNEGASWFLVDPPGTASDMIPILATNTDLYVQTFGENAGIYSVSLKSLLR
jgi:hypothetical protein